MNENALRIEYRKVDALIPYCRNARTHSDAQVAQLAASIVEWGWTNPVLVDGDNGVMSGHGRLLAARALGLAEVPVIEISHLTDTQKRAYILADNRLALSAGWDEELLALELAELTEAGYELTLTGFDDGELEHLLKQDVSTSDEGDKSDIADDADESIPDLPAMPVSRPGDIWQLGQHRLICGDAADARVIAALMAGEEATLCFTSPPYGNQRDYTNTIVDWDSLMRGVFTQLPMTENGQVLVNLGLIHRENEFLSYWDDWLAWMRIQGWRRFGWYVWDQGPGLPGDWNGRLAPSFEFVFHFNRQGSEVRRPNKIVPCIYAGRDTHLRGDGTSAGGMRNKDGSKTTWNHVGTVTQETKIPDSVIRVMRHKGKIGRDIDHPAVFPVALPQHIFDAYTETSEIIFEPFCGSGTGLLAAQKTNRQMRAVEIAPEYVDVAIKRFHQNHPDLPVTLIGSGDTFEQVSFKRQLRPSTGVINEIV